MKILGSAQLDKMFEYFDMDEDEESESVSVGGWVLEQLGKMAEVGDTFEYKIFPSPSPTLNSAEL